MNKHKSFALTVSLMLLAWLTAAAGSKTVVKAQLDSATLLMGRTVKMHVEITGPDVQGFLSADQADTLNSRVEIAARLAGDTTKMGDGRRRIERDFLLQAFDSGLYVIKPLTYITGTDTAFSNTLTLKVLPVNVDTLADIHPLKPVIQIPFSLGDMIPSFISDYWWAWLALALLVAGGIYYYLHWYRKGRRNPLKTLVKRLPPYDEAMLNLQKLHDSHLWQQGQEDAYYVGLTDILRVYIDRRFGISAMEMTSSQIVDTLRRNDETRAVNEQLGMILEVADIVKFARQHPLADDNELAYRRAVDFVEQTRPVETPKADNAPEPDGNEARKEAKP